MDTLWVVDANYIVRASEFYGAVDYLKLKMILEKLNGAPITSSYFFDNTKNNPKQDRFIWWLQSSQGPNMNTRLYGMKPAKTYCKRCKADIQFQVQKGVDVGIATLILTSAFEKGYDRVILSAGDGDFKDALYYVRNTMKKEVWITGFEGTVSGDFYGDCTSVVILLDKYWDKIKKER